MKKARNIPINMKNVYFTLESYIFVDKLKQKEKKEEHLFYQYPLENVYIRGSEIVIPSRKIFKYRTRVFLNVKSHGTFPELRAL